jgi:hypothetical protein
MNTTVKAKAPFILVVAAAFFVYQLQLLLNSFGADYTIVQRALGQLSTGTSLWPLVWVTSELTGEAGVILRFVGACFFLVFAAVLLVKKVVSVSFLRKSVLLEGIYYLFNLPFIVYLLVRPDGSNVTLGAALSFAAQLALVTPIFLKLYFTLKKPCFNLQQTARWTALAVTAFTFALWAKHFALALYALPPFSFENPVWLVGFVNSAFTLLLAGLLVTAAFWSTFKKSGVYRNHLFGAALILMGVYVVVFLVISVLTPNYAVWIDLIDWWLIAMPVLGISLLHKN